MADDKVTIWGGGLKFGRKPADGELLVGDGASFEMTTLTAGSGVTISNTPGAIQISATGSGGTVTDVTATSPLASSGGATPDISLTGAVAVANGGTGASTLTAENVILGDGTNPVKFVAPGASGNVLTSNGTTWASAAPPVQWEFLYKTADQAVTSNNTTYVDITDLQFTMAANENYLIRGCLIVNHSSGGFEFSFDGPASPTQINGTAYASNLAGFTSLTGAYGSLVAEATVTAAQTWMFNFNFFIKNGSNTTPDFTLQFRQNASSALATTVREGSWLEWKQV